MKYFKLYHHPDAISTAAPADTAPAKSDFSKLKFDGPISISPDQGNTDEAFPKPDTPYDFVVHVQNSGTEKCDAFLVKFKFDPDSDNPNPDADLTFKQDAGLEASDEVMAVVHFGNFPNSFQTYNLEACIYDPAAPENPINCLTYGITINTVDSASNTTDSTSGNNNNNTSSNTGDNTDAGSN